MIQIIPDADYSGNGLASVASPLPSHGGKLFATYLPGSGWNGLSNAGQDYSGQRGDLYLGSAAVSAGVGAMCGTRGNAVWRRPGQMATRGPARLTPGVVAGGGTEAGARVGKHS